MPPVRGRRQFSAAGVAKRHTTYVAYYAPEGRLQSSSILPADGCSGQGQIPGILVEPLREWRNWQTRKT
jgi:hypothetical protein